MEDIQEVVEQLFVTVLGLDPNERSAYLSRVCHDSPAIRERVEQMLNEDALAGSFLKHPLFDRSSTIRPVDDLPTTSGTIGQAHLAAVSRQYSSQFKPGDVLLDRFKVIKF